MAFFGDRSPERGVVLALASFGLGLLVRWPLQPLLGTKLIWLTFYPCLMVAGLWGGFVAGILTAGFSIAFTYLGWNLLSPQPYIKDLGDHVGVAVFAVNAILVALLAESVRRANDRTQQALVAAEAANRAKSSFLAQMSHELRTPFNALLGFTDRLLAAPDTTAHQRASLAIIRKSAHHLLDLINSVLDMSRIESRKVTVARVPVDLPSLVSDVVDLLRPKIEGAGLQVKTVFADQALRLVLSDPLILRHILMNLVGNAAKFSHQGTITVGLAPSPVGPGRVSLSVSDEGPGIAVEDRSRIFEPFHQLPSAAEHEGTGLGLAIVRQFTEALGGKVEVESELGKGSVFTVDFPAEAGEAQQLPEPVSPMVPLWKMPLPQSRCLVVDDHEENRELLHDVLLDLGQSVRMASDGNQAIEEFVEWAPQVIWLDLRMPGMTGKQTVRALRELPGGSDAVVIAVTASVFPDQLNSLLAEGFDAWLTKPFELDRVPELLRTFLRSTSETADQVPELTPDERRRLTDAVAALDPVKIDACVQSIQDRSPVLASRIRAYSAVLDYAGLSRWLHEHGQLDTTDG